MIPSRVFKGRLAVMAAGPTLAVLLAAGELQKVSAEAAQKADPLSAAVQDIFRRCSRAVVKIEAEDDSGDLAGTGFFVDPNGTIFTNYSVGGESHDIVVSDGEARYPASRIAADPRSGLAILKIEAQRTPFLPLGRSNHLGVGTMVMAIGYPMDLPVTPNVGCLGGFGITAGERHFGVSHIRANVAVQRGEGGAPLLNMAGEVVGLVESSLDGGAGCFVLPIEAADKVHNDVMHFGEVRPGWLGIRCQKSHDATPKVIVEGFAPGSPATKAGVLEGDVVLKVGNREVATMDDVMDASFYLTSGEDTSLTVMRGTRVLTFTMAPVPSPVGGRPELSATPALPVFNLSVQMTPSPR